MALYAVGTVQFGMAGGKLDNYRDLDVFSVCCLGKGAAGGQIVDLKLVPKRAVRHLAIEGPPTSIR